MITAIQRAALFLNFMSMYHKVLSVHQRWCFGINGSHALRLSNIYSHLVSFNIIPAKSAHEQAWLTPLCSFVFVCFQRQRLWCQAASVWQLFASMLHLVLFYEKCTFIHQRSFRRISAHVQNIVHSHRITGPLIFRKPQSWISVQTTFPSGDTSKLATLSSLCPNIGFPPFWHLHHLVHSTKRDDTSSYCWPNNQIQGQKKIKATKNAVPLMATWGRLQQCWNI